MQEGKKYDDTLVPGCGGMHSSSGRRYYRPRYPRPDELEMLQEAIRIDHDNRPSFMDRYLSVALVMLVVVLMNIGELSILITRIIGERYGILSVPTTRRYVVCPILPHNIPAHIMGNAKLVKGKNGQSDDLADMMNGGNISRE